MSDLTLPDYMQPTLRFYEDFASEYAANTTKMGDMEWMHKFAGLLPNAGRVLDVGCAAGRDSRWFLEQGFEPYGIDISPKMVALGTANVKEADFRVMDMMDMAFEEDFFDGVWCSCALIHIKKTDMVPTLKEFARVLKKGGILYILVKHGDGEGVEYDERYGGAAKFASYVTKEELENYVQEARFTIIENEGLDKKVDEYRASNRIFLLARK